MDAIRFYSVSGEYGCFSNFSPHPIRLKGKTWPTSEHYFQAQKFAGTPDEEEVRQAKSPMIAARMGRSRKRPLRKDWESAKDAIMHEAVLAKFTQHADLQKILLATGDAEIVEHTAERRATGATAATVAARTCWARSSCGCGRSCATRRGLHESSESDLPGSTLMPPECSGPTEAFGGRGIRWTSKECPRWRFRGYPSAR